VYKCNVFQISAKLKSFCLDNFLHFPLNIREEFRGVSSVLKSTFLFCVILVVSLNLSHTSSGTSKHIMFCCFTLFALHCLLYTVRFTLFALHCLLYTVCFTLFALHCLLYIVCFTLFALHCLLYTVCFTLFALHCLLYTVCLHCLLYTVCFTLSALHCLLYTVCFTLFALHCLLYAPNVSLKTLK
jgi:hypothetical protein